MKNILALLLITIVALLCGCGANSINDETHISKKGFSGRGPYGPVPDFNLEDMPHIESEFSGDRYHEWDKPPVRKIAPPENAVETYEKTKAADIETLLSKNEMIITDTYYKLDNGSYECGGYNYKYRLDISGRLHNAERDSRYIILSNSQDITFEQAWKASGLSSNTNDYFALDYAIIVERAGL